MDRRNGAALAERARLCDSVVSRFCGLMLQPALANGGGIILSPCGSVHMGLMRFSIDVLYLDRDCRAVKLVRDLRPYRVSFGGRHARAALELPAGTLARLDVLQDDLIQLQDETGAPVGL